MSRPSPSLALIVSALATLLARPALAQTNAAAASRATAQLSPPPADGTANETPVVAETRPAPAPPPGPALKFGGGAILWYYQPFLPESKNNLEVFFANIILDGRAGDFGFHLEPRFRESQLRPFFSGPAWIQEAYGSYDLRGETSTLTVKAGKVYSHFGLFWDNSFYGNVQVYDGLKLTPNYGLSIEAESQGEGRLGGKLFLQYFVVDGHTNVALPGRETFSIPGARRRNESIVRLEPTLRVGEAARLALGLSGQYLQADLPVIGKNDVWREAVDLTWSLGTATFWGEATLQQGLSVSEFPIAGTPATATTPAVPGQASRSVRYALAGGQYSVGPITARYVFSLGDYADLDVREILHVPSIGVALEEHLSLLGELVLWRRNAPSGATWVDRSFNVTLYAHF